MQNLWSVHSPCVGYTFQERVMRLVAIPPKSRLRCITVSCFYGSFKKGRLHLLFSSLSEMLSELLHAFVTIPEPWAGIFKALSAAAPRKVIDDCESRRKHSMLTKWRAAHVGRHFLLYTLPVYYLCSWSMASVPLVHICLVCLGSDLTAVNKTEQSISKFLVIFENSLN